MSPLSEACDDARQWLPEGAVLVAQPDTGAVTRGGKPGSRPPWNPEAAAAVYDAIAMITATEALFRRLVTGQGDRKPAAATGRAISAIEGLSHAVPHYHAKAAARDLARCVLAIQQLTAVDEIERPQRIPGVGCAYCRIPMLMTLPKAGVVYCKLGGAACWDSNGDPPRGHVTVGRLGACVEWQDGLVT